MSCVGCYVVPERKELYEGIKLDWTGLDWGGVCAYMAHTHMAYSELCQAIKYECL